MDISINEIGDGLIYCPTCGDYANQRELGVLGRLHWFRCGNCGRDHAIDLGQPVAVGPFGSEARSPFVED